MPNEHRLDPEPKELAPLFANFINLDDIPATRVNLAAMLAMGMAQAPMFDDVAADDAHAPGLKRAPDVLVRVYRPKNSKSALPAVYYIHDGGMVQGSIADNDVYCKTLVRELNCVVAAVPLDLHMYPGAFHGFATLAPASAVAQRANANIVRALRRAFGR
jgi:acetyl esterase/lipase